MAADQRFDLHCGGRDYALHNMDCIEGMRQHLEPGSVDVVVTSPPYNLGTS